VGRVVYGVLVGAAAMAFRYYGAYETGVCFALLLVNSVSGWLDRGVQRIYRILHHAQHERQERERPMHEKPQRTQENKEEGGAAE
jgi:electron transport complex protein RnfD